MINTFSNQLNLKYMKLLTSLTIVLFIVSCGNNDSSDLEKKKTELAKYQSELNELKTKIANLEKEIAALDTNAKFSEIGVLVETKTIQPEKFEHYFEVSGTVTTDDNITLSAEAAGQIKTILVIEGQKVTAGQVLAKLNTATIESSIEEVKTALELATTVYERQKKLWDQKIGSEIQYLQAKNNKESLEQKLKTLQTQLSLSIIKAPGDGIVDEIYRKEGEMVMPGTPVMQFVNLNNMKMISDVSEMYVKSVKQGDKASVSFPALGIENIEAVINRTSNVINLKNRTFKVEVSLPNKEQVLKPNAIGMLKIKDFEADSAFVVPTMIIGKDSKGEYVYVVKENDGKNIARKTYIKTGKSSGGQTMIVDGITLNDKVITAGYNEVSDGAIVRIK
ncbi:MAG: efflux RND transporter periplasmic adaptor subunit [Bacteroidia bacterium]